MNNAVGTYTLDSTRYGDGNTPVYSYYNGSTTYYLFRAVDDNDKPYWVVGSSFYAGTSGPIYGTAYIQSNASTPPTGSWGDNGVTVTAN